MTTKRQMIAVTMVLFLLASVATGFAANPEPQGGAAAQSAGKISALLPVAKVVRGQGAAAVSTDAKKNDAVLWNDLVRTEKGGRARVTLNDNSILSVGSQSELRIVQHDAQSKQTSLELTYGRVRSEVTRVTRANGKFEVKTPTAVAGVIGTDFGTIAEPGQTIFLCITGQVEISSSDPGVPGSVICGPGQFVIVRAGSAPTAPEPLTPEQIIEFLLGTEPAEVAELSPSAAAPGSTVNSSAIGSNLQDIEQVEVTGGNLQANLAGGGSAMALPLQIIVAADAAPGARVLTFIKPGANPIAAVFMVMPPAGQAGQADPLPAIKGPQTVEAGAVAGFDGSGSQGGGNAAIQAYQWDLCQPGTACTPISGFGSAESVFNVSTCALAPGVYPLRLTVTDSNNKSGSALGAFEVLTPGYETPAQRVYTLAGMYSALQPESFLSLFDSSFAGFSVLQENIRRTFEQLASMSINLRSMQESINCDDGGAGVATVRTDWEAKYSFKHDPTQVISDPVKQVTVRLVREPGKGWYITDLQGDNGLVQGMPPGPGESDEATPNLQVLSVTSGGPPAALPQRQGAPSTQTVVPPGSNTFTATVTNSGPVEINAPINVRFSAAGTSTEVPLPMPLAPGQQASVSGTLNLDLAPGTETSVEVTVNPTCAAPELPSECADNTFSLQISIGVVDLAVTSVTGAGTLIGTQPGSFDVGVQNTGTEPTPSSTVTLTSAALSGGSASAAVPALSSGQATVVTVSGTLLNVAGTQSFTASVPADDNNANNSLSGSAVITQAVVDLEVQAFAPAAALVGTQTGTLQVTLKNLGNVPSGAATGALQVAEVEGPGIGTADLPAIVAGGSTVVNLDFTVPNSTGTDLVVFINPAVALDTNAANDSLTQRVAITPTAPDYTITALEISGRPSGATGANALQRFADYTLLVTVANVGNASATETLNLEAKCFPEPDCDNTTPPVGSGAAPAAGTTTVISIPLGAQDMVPGAYTGEATLAASPNEFNTANNVGTLPFEVGDFAIVINPAVTPQNVAVDGVAGTVPQDVTGSGASAPFAVGITAGAGVSATVGTLATMNMGDSQNISVSTSVLNLQGQDRTLTVTGTRDGVSRNATHSLRFYQASLQNRSTGLPGETAGDPLRLDKGAATSTDIEFQLIGNFVAPLGTADISVDPNAAFSVLQLDSATATPNGANFLLTLQASPTAAETPTTVIIRAAIPNTSPAREVTYTVNVLPFARPDLTPTALAPQGGRDFASQPWLSGEPVDVDVTIENIGLGASPATTVEVSVRGVPVGSASVPAIAAGGSTVVTVHCVGQDPMLDSNFSGFQAEVDAVALETELANQSSPFTTISTSNWAVQVTPQALAAGTNTDVTPTVTRTLDSQPVPNTLTWVAGNVSSFITQTIGAGSPPTVNVALAAGVADGTYLGQVIAQMKDGATTTAQRLGTIEVTTGGGAFASVNVTSSVGNHSNTAPKQLNGPLPEIFNIQAESLTAIDSLDLLISDSNAITTTPNFIQGTNTGIAHAISVAADVTSGGFISTGATTSTVSAVAVQPTPIIIFGGVKNTPVGTNNTTLYYNVGDVYGSSNFCYDLLPGQSVPVSITISILSGFNLPSVDWQWSSLPAGLSVDVTSGNATLGAGDYGTFDFVVTNNNTGMIAGYSEGFFAIMIQNANGSATRTQTIRFALSDTDTCAAVGAPVRLGQPVPGVWTMGRAIGGGASMTLGSSASAGLPDVRIDAREVSYTPSMPRAGDTVAVRFRLRNTGDADAVGVPVALRVDGRIVATDTFDVRKGGTTLAGIEWNSGEDARTQRFTRGGRGSSMAAGSAGGAAMLVVDPSGTVKQKSAQEKSAVLQHFALATGAAAGTSGGLGRQRVLLEVPEGECVGLRLDSGATTMCGAADVEFTVGDLAGAVYMMSAPEGIASLGLVAADASPPAASHYAQEVAVMAGHTYAVQTRSGGVAMVTVEVIRNPQQTGARAAKVFGSGGRRGTPGLGSGSGAVETGDTSGTAPSSAAVQFRISYSSQ